MLNELAVSFYKDEGARIKVSASCVPVVHWRDLFIINMYMPVN
jgi:hypothetical protein